MFLMTAACSEMNKKVNSLTLKDKLDVLQDVKNDINKQALCIKYKINKSTLNRIIKNEEQIRNLVASGKNINRKRLRNGVYGKVEKALEMWVKENKKSNAALTQSMILDKAKELARKFNEDFNPGLSWLYRWCKRENINIREATAKPNEKVNKTNESYYAQTILPIVLQDYDSDCIFNAKECGLYYKVTPNACNGMEIDANEREMRKARLTLVFICNATATFKRVYAIGRKKIPALKNSNSPVPYFVNKNALLTSTLWNTILSDLDAEMCVTNKDIVLFATKTSGLQIKATPKNINVQLLNPKSSILIPPLDNGIIKTFKLNYREQMIKKQLCASERGQSLRQFTNEFSVLNALFSIKQAWAKIKPATIQKIFEKSSFICQEKNDPTEIDNNSVLKLIPNKMDYIHIDDNLKCTESVNKRKENHSRSYQKNPLSDEDDEDEEIEELEYESDDSQGAFDSDVIEEDNTEIEVTTAKAALLAVETIQNFCMLNNIESDSFEQIEKSICKHLIRQTRQAGNLEF